MKKIYNQPEIEVLVIEEEEIVTGSVVNFDPHGLLDGTADEWQW